MKRCLSVLICCLLFCCFSGCKYIRSKVVYQNFYCRVIDENNIAIGDLRIYPESGVVFFPERIQNYTVSKLGFSTGMGFGGNGYFSATNQAGVIIKRCYFPHTIKEIHSGYMYLISRRQLKIFYCGNIIDLDNFAIEDNAEIYVPAEEFELFKNELSEYYSGSLLKANVAYFSNYDENNYYYIDYYENGEEILYIPPEPQREGYSFDGWFKESACINEWDFEVDTIQFSDEIQEIKLYAKWFVV